MDNRELRLGNLILINGETKEVAIISSLFINNLSVLTEDFEPINLIPELFNKLDFRSLSGILPIFKNGNNEYFISFENGYYQIILQYVHQLQNIYFQIVGEELDITKII